MPLLRGREPEIWVRGRWCRGRGKAIGAAQEGASSSTEGDWRGPPDMQSFLCRCNAHFVRKTVRLRVPTKHLHTVTGCPRRWFT